MNFYGYTNNASASESPTFESIQKAIADFEERFKPKELPPEHIVMTTECFEALRQHTEEQGLKPMTGPINHLLGIPIEHFPTEAQCVGRAIELYMEHKIRVAVVSADRPSEQKPEV